MKISQFKDWEPKLHEEVDTNNDIKTNDIKPDKYRIDFKVGYPLKGRFKETDQISILIPASSEEEAKNKLKEVVARKIVADFIRLDFKLSFPVLNGKYKDIENISIIPGNELEAILKQYILTKVNTNVISIKKA